MIYTSARHCGACVFEMLQFTRFSIDSLLSLSIYSGIALVWFGIPFGVGLRSVWTRSGIGFGSVRYRFGGRFGIDLVSVWYRFGVGVRSV